MDLKKLFLNFKICEFVDLEVWEFIDFQSCGFVVGVDGSWRYSWWLMEVAMVERDEVVVIINRDEGGCGSF